MSTADTKTRLTPEEYLAVENAASFRSEYRDGEMYAMSGAAYEHTAIASNIQGEMHTRLKGGACRPSNFDLRVYVPATQFYTYPDVTVVCGPPQFADAGRTTIVNPSLIVEVLSPSTEHYDRTAKFWNYQSIDSLQDYLLIAQETPLVEHFFRQTTDKPANRWLYTAYKGLAAILRLPSLNIELPLREIYEGVVFPPLAVPPPGNGVSS